MFPSAAFPAPAALLPWAFPPLAPVARLSQGEPSLPEPRSLERCVPVGERPLTDRYELVIALIEGPGFCPAESVCVEALLRRLKPLWALVSPFAIQSIRFRNLWIDHPEGLAHGLPLADLLWLQLAGGSPLTGRTLACCVPPGAPDRAVLALVRGDMLTLSPEPAQPLRAQDGLVLRGAR